MAEEKFAEWCILELMGHRRLAGKVTEQEVAGAPFLRIDVPGTGDDVEATQFYAPGSVYCLTPTTEAIARAVAASSRPEPVQRWDIRQPQLSQGQARRCRVCGCTEQQACMTPEGPCHWVEQDLCSACAGREGDDYAGDE